MIETEFSKILDQAQDWDRAVRAAKAMGVKVPDPVAMHRVLEQFVSCIEVTGGITAEEGPVADPEWLDLAELAEAAMWAASVIDVPLTVQGEG